MSSKKLNKNLHPIRKLLADYRKNCEAILKNKPLLKGTLVVAYVHCGRPNCHCIKKKTLHRKIFLKYSKEGKIQSVYVKIDQRKIVKKLTDDFRTFRTARADIVKIHSEILNQINKIEKLNVLQLDEIHTKLKK